MDSAQRPALWLPTVFGLGLAAHIDRGSTSPAPSVLAFFQIFFRAILTHGERRAVRFLPHGHSVTGLRSKPTDRLPDAYEYLQVSI